MILRARERCLRCSHKCCSCLGSGEFLTVGIMQLWISSDIHWLMSTLSLPGWYFSAELPPLPPCED
ncbi:hypothetical protein E2C01_021243 [Portunus trituberculatus]|uniref:Uncharacterized protein n=1 Tax=Portunus trituberculatus TaxID=210409 RepID=A0A5B7E266_PORTR|nr:hypothetical protein [Portunus trituberculatus]